MVKSWAAVTFGQPDRNGPIVLDGGGNLHKHGNDM